AVPRCSDIRGHSFPPRPPEASHDRYNCPQIDLGRSAPIADGAALGIHRRNAAGPDRDGDPSAARAVGGLVGAVLTVSRDPDRGVGVWLRAGTVGNGA